MKILGMFFLSSICCTVIAMDRVPSASTQNQIVLAQAKSSNPQIIGLPSALRESPPSSSSSSSVAQMEAVERGTEPARHGSRIVIDQRDGTNIVLELSLPPDTESHAQQIRIALENNDRHVKKALRQQMAEDALRIVCRDDEKHYKECEYVLPKLRKTLKDSLKKKPEQTNAQQSPQPATRASGKEADNQDIAEHILRLKDVSIAQLSARRAEEVAKKTPPQTPDLEAQTSATRKPTPSPRELYLKTSSPKNGSSQNPINTAIDSSLSELEKLVRSELAAQGASERTQKKVSIFFNVLSLATAAAFALYKFIPTGTTIPGTNITLPPA